MNSVILHLILAFLTLVGAVGVYIYWWRDGFVKKSPRKQLFLFFIFFTAYHLFLSLPFLFFHGNLRLMAFGYNFAILAIFLMSVPIFRVYLGFYELSPQKIKLIINTFLLVGIALIIGLFYDLRLPFIDESGFIIWRVNLFLGILNTIVIGTLPFLFGLSFLKNLPRGITSIEKVKVFFLSFGSFSFALSCIYFAVQNLFMVIIAFIFVTLGIIFWIISLFIHRKKLISSTVVN